MKKLIFLFFILPFIVIAQEGGYRSLKTISAKVYLSDQTGSQNRLLIVQPNGHISNIPNGIGVLHNNSGAFSYWNYAFQTLTGTTPTWNVNSGLGAYLTVSGNTSITLTNLISGMSGVIEITNPVTVYKLQFVGFSTKLGNNITVDATGMTLSGGSKFDTFSWVYDGAKLVIHGNFDYKSQTW